MLLVCVAGFVALSLVSEEVVPAALEVFVCFIGRDAGNVFENAEETLVESKVIVIQILRDQSFVGSHIKTHAPFIYAVDPINKI